METRPLKKRRGSALAISLIVAASLGVLLTLASARWKVLRQRAEDAVLHEILENAALDMLERVTAWTAEQKPANPADKTYDGVELTSEDGLDTLVIELPEPLRRSVSGGAALTSALHWCVFTPPAKLNWRVLAKDYPPSLYEPLENVKKRVFVQSFEQSAPGMAPASPHPRRGAYRIMVTAVPAENEGLRDRVVLFERVITVER